MEFTIERSELLAALYLTQGIVERRTTIPILGNVLLQSAGGGVVIAATDQEIAVRRQCAASVKKKGTLTTGGRRLYEMVREFPEGPVHVASLENNWIEVAAGRSRFRLVGLDPREFPAMPQPEADAKQPTLRLAASALEEMIEKTIFAVSADETRVNLNGIYIESPEKGRVRMVATDGHRLAMVTRDADGATLDKGFIIPRKGVQEMRKVLEGGDEPIELTVVGGMVHGERGGVQLSVRLVEGDFPDYRQVVPAKSDKVAVLEVGPLLSALRRVSIVSSERTRGVKFQLEGQRLELSSINPDVGEAAEELEVEYASTPLSIGFNARYLMDMLAILGSGAKLEMGLNDDVSPGALHVIDDPDYRYIVMPMRL